MPHDKITPTMADVARLAGVSTMTVSRALRRTGAVSNRTRDVILEVIEEIGYVPDQAAGALSSGRSGLVGLILPSMATPPYPQIAAGLDSTLAAHGLQLFPAFSDYSASREERLLRDILKRRPEAVALAGVEHSDLTRRLLKQAGVPVVEFYDQPEKPIDHLVTVDDRAVAKLVIDRLVSTGRKQIAILASRSELDDRGQARAAAIVAAAEAAGLASPLVTRHGSPLNWFEQGKQGAADALRQSCAIDALVALHDFAAIGALGELRRQPAGSAADIAVIGFGDCDIGQHFVPSLTTIGFNASSIGVEIGKVLISTLSAMKSGYRSDPYRLSVEFQLVERESA